MYTDGSAFTLDDWPECVGKRGTGSICAGSRSCRRQGAVWHGAEPVAAVRQQWGGNHPPAPAAQATAIAMVVALTCT